MKMKSRRIFLFFVAATGHKIMKALQSISAMPTTHSSSYLITGVCKAARKDQAGVSQLIICEQKRKGERPQVCSRLSIQGQRSAGSHWIYKPPGGSEGVVFFFNFKNKIKRQKFNPPTPFFFSISWCCFKKSENERCRLFLRNDKGCRKSPLQLHPGCGLHNTHTDAHMFGLSVIFKILLNDEFIIIFFCLMQMEILLTIMG